MELQPLNISFESAAKLLGISRTTLYQMSSDGRLGIIPHKIGARTLINYKELEAWTDAKMPPREIWQQRNNNEK